jgi:hypothetical protein
VPQQNYRDEGHDRGSCTGLAAHYKQIQAIVDALSHAAQMEQASALADAGEAWAPAFGDGKPAPAVRAWAIAANRAERYGGAWLALRGILRVIESADFERGDFTHLHADLTPSERAMLARIDWEREQFRFPGIERFEGVEIVEPGTAKETLHG